MTWWLWIICGLMLVAAEMISASFYLIFFGISAIVVGILARLNLAGPEWMSWLLFSVLSLGSLGLFRKQLLKKFQQHDQPELDTMIGEIATAASDIAVNGQGKAELRGSQWMALNTGTDAIARGQTCVVDRVNGIVLHVRAR